MPGKLFVGNLSYDVVEADLERFCSDLNIQTASIKVMRDMETGRSRGFGFIELAPETELDAAVEAMNGKELNRRTMNVNEARPPRKRESGGGRRFDSRPGGGGFGGDGRFGRNSGGFGGDDSRRKKRERPKRKYEELY